MPPTLRTLSPVNPRSDDKHTRPRSPPYPSPPNEDLNPIDKHLPKPPPPRPTSPKPQPASNTNAVAAPQPAPQDEDEEEDEEPNRDDIIDMEVLGQLLELDEDDPDFSKEMAFAYFSQAETTFKDLDAALSSKDLEKLSSLGHYFKGSSAALGVKHVQEHCERIQHYGLLRDEEADKNLSPSEALSAITRELARVKKDYRTAEKWLKDYYKEDDS